MCPAGALPEVPRVPGGELGLGQQGPCLQGGQQQLLGEMVAGGQGEQEQGEQEGEHGGELLLQLGVGLSEGQVALETRVTHIWQLHWNPHLDDVAGKFPDLCEFFRAGVVKPVAGAVVASNPSRRANF